MFLHVLWPPSWHAVRTEGDDWCISAAGSWEEGCVFAYEHCGGPAVWVVLCTCGRVVTGSQVAFKVKSTVLLAMHGVGQLVRAYCAVTWIAMGAWVATMCCRPCASPFACFLLVMSFVLGAVLCLMLGL